MRSIARWLTSRYLSVLKGSGVRTKVSKRHSNEMNSVTLLENVCSRRMFSLRIKSEKNKCILTSERNLLWQKIKLLDNEYFYTQ